MCLIAKDSNATILWVIAHNMKRLLAHFWSKNTTYKGTNMEIHTDWSHPASP